MVKRRKRMVACGGLVAVATASVEHSSRARFFMVLKCSACGVYMHPVLSQSNWDGCRKAAEPLGAHDYHWTAGIRADLAPAPGGVVR